MLIPKKNRVEIYKYLMQEGVLYAEKDYNKGKHDEIDVPNLHVIKLMETFASKEYVRHQFAWRHHYWFVTNEGIEYLRTYLNLPSSIVPETLKKSQRSASRPAGAAPGGVPASAPAAGTGRGYGGAGAMEKASAAPSGYSAQFGRGGGGYGRGSA